MLQALIETLLDALGLTGTFFDRHRVWITALFVGLFVAVGAVIVLAIIMVAAGHS